MKKIIKKYICVLISIVTCLCVLKYNVYAMGNEEIIIDQNARDYLLDSGCPKEVINSFSESEIEHLVSNLKNGEASISWGCEEIDNLEWLQYVVNSSDEKLMQDGFSQDEIKRVRKREKELKCKTDVELMEVFDIDESAIEGIRRAFEINKKYERKKIASDDVVSLSASLSDSKLSHSFYADYYSGVESERKYRIRYGFNWTSPFFSDFFEDQIAVAWAGNFVYVSETLNTIADYYHCYGGVWPYFYYGSCAERSKFNVVEQKPNYGVVFSTPQTIVRGITQNFLKTGYVSFFIKKKHANNEYVNITAQYLHKSIGTSSFSISSSGISISGAGCDYVSNCDTLVVRS